MPPTAPIDERRERLQELAPDLPDSYSLSEVIFTVLISEKLLNITPWPTYELLAKTEADMYLTRNQMENIFRAPTREAIKMDNVGNVLKLTVHRIYQTLTKDVSLHEPEIITTIELKRLAGHIGYHKPLVSHNLVSNIDPILMKYQRL